MVRSLAWIAAAIAAALAAWWYFAPQTLPTAVRHAVPLSPNAAKAAPVLYKWRDEKGRLNVTDVAPKDRPYESVTYDPNTNVVPGYRSPDAADQRPIPPDPAKQN
ncbi:uncharacterized protein DUF4124 [Tahibacter aquaticus]|uniref:Uncharacterized protein DUF4124 n=1 Tax=Tahibacter aquaticus TaxID=520092 RepID=A0A4R6Z4A7_9GAMM|nr:DUF4124 domain-containing protein [Tahibacter aquaticus]TDR46518.1 uncharacterized protein DUF4124 [Tahibacter aquaticus]